MPDTSKTDQIQNMMVPYRYVLSALIVIAFSFQIGAFQIYGLKLFTALSFPQHITLAISSLPAALFLLSFIGVISMLLGLLINPLVKLAVRLINSKSAETFTPNPANGPYPGYLVLTMCAISLSFVLASTTVMGVVVSIAFVFISIFINSLSRLEANGNRYITPAILSVLVVAVSLFAGAESARWKLDSSENHKDMICHKDKCEYVNTLLTLPDAAIYQKNRIVYYRSFSTESRVGVTLGDELSFYKILFSLFSEEQTG